MPLARHRWAEPADHLILAESPAAVDAMPVPLAPVAFVVGWVAIGVTVGLVLGRRGHDPRLMVTLGAGLGPLMLALAPETAAAAEAVESRELAAGTRLGGEVDVLVMVPDEPRDVLAAHPNLEAVAPVMRTLTLGRALPYEVFGPSPDDAALDEATATLSTARHLIGHPEAALVAYPGTTDAVARSFRDRATPTLVLLPAAETPIQDGG